MNCKPGDLAVKVALSTGKDRIPVGAIVRIIRLSRSLELRLTTGESMATPSDNWDVEWRGETHSPEGWIWGVRDSCLRPIRDNDDEDETLQWTPVPVTEAA